MWVFCAAATPQPAGTWRDGDTHFRGAPRVTSARRVLEGQALMAHSSWPLSGDSWPAHTTHRG